MHEPVHDVITLPGLTPASSAWLGQCVSALHRGVTLGDLLDSIAESCLRGPWVTLRELADWAETVARLPSRLDQPPADWLAACVELKLDPVTGDKLPENVIDIRDN